MLLYWNASWSLAWQHNTSSCLQAGESRHIQHKFILRKNHLFLQKCHPDASIRTWIDCWLLAKASSISFCSFVNIPELSYQGLCNKIEWRFFSLPKSHSNSKLHCFPDCCNLICGRTSFCTTVRSAQGCSSSWFIFLNNGLVLFAENVWSHVTLLLRIILPQWEDLPVLDLKSETGWDWMKFKWWIRWSGSG